ncbi:hypothetical protein [Amycolatopsis echigonensis]|uniref:Subtilisin inhibitor-like n=1 Tax=Amycolatopsis echigonensis TaxID=2576905 RepID=A0A2N3WB12_9PSEU|nr:MULTISPECIES: hypothetical protein [Amycolatopsis]MBB2500657.1 hypothetical protein [Amycolatopsis echigonensis]PKV91070.1 hypothetical protein ATK30_1830 [Amycolatopsis niigatensis]
MRTMVTKAVVTASMLAFGGLAAACGGGSSDPAAQSAALAAPTVTSAPESPAYGTESAPASKTPGPSTSQGSGADTGATAGPPVDCGPVDAPNGKVGVVATETKAGRPGCTEAIDVITEYFQDAPKKAEGTAHVLMVSGWRCMADTGAQGSGRVGCDKDGRVFYTQP